MIIVKRTGLAVFTFIFALMLSFALVGCSSEESESTTGETTTTTTQEPTEEPSTAERLTEPGPVEESSEAEEPQAKESEAEEAGMEESAEEEEGDAGAEPTTAPSISGYYTPDELFENVHNPYGISEGSQYESLLQKALEEYYLANTDAILGEEEAPTFSEYTRERYGTPIYAQTPVYENAPYPNFYFSQDEIDNMSQEDIDSLVAALIDNAKEQTVNPDDIFISGAYNPNMASLYLNNGAYKSAAFDELVNEEEKAAKQAEEEATSTQPAEEEQN